MPSYKLSYFDIKGRAEPIRLAFHIGGIPFEDDRFPSPEWSARKESMPFGQVPALTIDNNFVLAQTEAILRYVGKLTGLYPKDALEAAKVDMMLGVAGDIGQAIGVVCMEKDEARKAAARETLLNEKLPAILGYLERYLTSHGSAGGYCVGENLTVADLQMHAVFAWGKLNGVSQDLIDKYKRVHRVLENVDKNEKVVSWNKAHKQ